MGLTARREVLSPRLRLMVGGGFLGPRRGRLRASVSGSASILRRIPISTIHGAPTLAAGRLRAAVLGHRVVVYIYKSELSRGKLGVG